MRELKKRIDELPGQLDSIYKALEKQFQQLIEIYAKQNLFVLSCEGPIKYTDSIANNLFSVEANLLAFNKLLTDDDKQLIIKHIADISRISGFKAENSPIRCIKENYEYVLPEVTKEIEGINCHNLTLKLIPECSLLYDWFLHLIDIRLPSGLLSSRMKVKIENGKIVTTDNNNNFISETLIFPINLGEKHSTRMALKVGTLCSYDKNKLCDIIKESELMLYYHFKIQYHSTSLLEQSNPARTYDTLIMVEL